MMFHPHRRIVFFLGVTCLTLGVVAATVDFHWSKYIVSTLFILVAVILLGPVLRNQKIEIEDDRLVVHTFGRTAELRPDHLVEVFRYKNGVLSYRFQSGWRHYQVTPVGYHHGALLQQEFVRLFDLARLGIVITGKER